MGSYAHLAGVDEDRVVGAVAHEVGVADMMLDEAAAKGGKWLRWGKGGKWLRWEKGGITLTRPPPKMSIPLRLALSAMLLSLRMSCAMSTTSPGRLNEWK